MLSIRCDSSWHCRSLNQIANLAVTLSAYSGFGALLGPPICGWLIASYGFRSAQIFSGVMLAVGTGFLVSNILIAVVQSYLRLLELLTLIIGHHQKLSRKIQRKINRLSEGVHIIDMTTVSAFALLWLAPHLVEGNLDITPLIHVAKRCLVFLPIVLGNAPVEFSAYSRFLIWSHQDLTSLSKSWFNQHSYTFTCLYISLHYNTPINYPPSST